MADSPKNSGAVPDALRQAAALTREKPAARPRPMSNKNKTVPETLTEEEYEAYRERLMIDNAWCAFALLGGLLCGGVAIFGAVRSFNAQVLWVAAVCVLIILFGLAASAMIGSVICWFSCYNRIMTSDRFIYLFGRVIPSLSLIFSMILRFVPRFGAQIKRIYGAQKALYGEEGENLRGRARAGLRSFSAMIDWALENSIQISDSMKSRGYGQRRRTAFSIFTFERRDGVSLLLILVLSAYILVGKGLGAVDYRYFPDFQAVTGGVYTATVFLAYGMLCAFPLLIDIRERIQWNVLESNN